ncbi:MAG TPA: hypothetical protein VHA52_05875 [Candidatus Babeliaceae bacterium]|nr:hypothetical protein [Candidatus Babeliaceae bacterium]
MKKEIDWKTITTKELAALIYQHLKNDEIDAVLVGGSCVTIYSKNKYVSQDLDYASHSDTTEIKNSLAKLGFIHRGKYFQHPECKFLVDFVASSVFIGDEIVKDKNLNKMKTKYGAFKLLSVEDCVKDRLAGFFYWSDRQSLEQAIMVCLDNKVSIKKIHEWAIAEGQEKKFLQFKEELKKQSLKKNFRYNISSHKQQSLKY